MWDEFLQVQVGTGFKKKSLSFNAKRCEHLNGRKENKTSRKQEQVWSFLLLICMPEAVEERRLILL